VSIRKQLIITACATAAAILMSSGAGRAQGQSDEINRRHSDALNVMSKGVGGRGYILSVDVVDAVNGREVQMSVMDRSRRRWVLGVDYASAEPRTRMATLEDGSLAIAVESAEPRFGIVNGEPLATAVGDAINAGLAEIARSRQAPKIRTIRVPSAATYVISWESGTGEKGAFAVNARGERTSVPQ
jgi:hypothetical protein